MLHPRVSSSPHHLTRLLSYCLPIPSGQVLQVVYWKIFHWRTPSTNIPGDSQIEVCLLPIQSTKPSCPALRLIFSNWHFISLCLVLFLWFVFSSELSCLLTCPSLWIQLCLTHWYSIIMVWLWYLQNGNSGSHPAETRHRGPGALRLHGSPCPWDNDEVRSNSHYTLIYTYTHTYPCVFISAPIPFFVLSSSFIFFLLLLSSSTSIFLWPCTALLSRSL